ncbi:MAG: CynX/NimT family MFS transporter [Myxococcota bacterium]
MTPSPYRFVVEGILFATYAAFGLSWIAVTPLAAEIQQEFGVGATGFAMLNTLVSIAKIVAPLLTGLLAVRFGVKRTLLVGSALIAASAVAPFAPGFELFLASRFVFGVGGAMVVTLLGPAVLQWFPKDEMPIVNALNNVAVNTGITITLFLTVPLAARLGWRDVLLAYSLVSVALTVAWAVFGRERGEAGGKAAGDARYRDVWRMRETWLVALCFSGPLSLYLAFNTFLPRYYVEAFGMEKAAASQYTGLFNLVGIPAAVIGGWATRRLGLRRPFLLGAGTLIGFAAFGMFLSPDPRVLLASAVVLGACLFVGASPLVTTAMELPGMTPAKVGLVMGTMLSFSYVLSSASPLLVGWLRDTTGSYVPGFAVWAAYSWVVALGGWLLPETGTRAPAAAAA